MLLNLTIVLLWAIVVEGIENDGFGQAKAPTTKSQLWPYGIVYYDIDNDLLKNDLAVDGIKDGVKMWSDKTCLKFAKRTKEDAYIFFYMGGDCYSEIGRTGYKQFVSLAPHCWQPGEAAHIIGHALGLYPEQSRYDRDKYVTINWDNIRDDTKPRFIKYPKGTADIKGFEYDYNSIMHFDTTAYSKNGSPTIVPKRVDVGIGQRNGPSVMDVKKLRLVYKCDNPGGGDGGTIPLPTTLQSTTLQLTTPHPTTPKPTTPEICADKWSRLRCMHLYGAGWCYKNPQVMKYYCKKTCNICNSGGNGGGGGGGICKDQLMYCSTWAQQGMCTTNQALMQRACRKSCNFCSGGSTGTESGGTGSGGTGGSSGLCYDKVYYCAMYVKYGWCHSMPDYMNNCRRSCKRCGVQRPV